MSKTLFVGNLPYDATEESVRAMFETHGPVESVSLVGDRKTGRFRGFGFVKMDEAGAETAADALDGEPVGNQRLLVNELSAADLA